MTSFRGHLLALAVIVSAPAVVAAQVSWPTHLVPPPSGRICVACPLAPAPPTSLLRDLALGEPSAAARRPSPGSSRSPARRAAIGAAIGAAAGVALGAVIGSDAREREEGFSRGVWIVGAGAVGALVGAVGGLLSR